jgi:hypothetical protein
MGLAGRVTAHFTAHPKNSTLVSDWKDGERGRNRTFNLLIKSQLLCQLSYAPGAKQL